MLHKTSSKWFDFLFLVNSFFHLVNFGFSGSTSSKYIVTFCPSFFHLFKTTPWLLWRRSLLLLTYNIHTVKVEYCRISRRISFQILLQLLYNSLNELKSANLVLTFKIPYDLQQSSSSVLLTTSWPKY